MFPTQRLLPLLQRPRGQIVFINSSAGLAARPGTGHFSATQHAFKALADARDVLDLEARADLLTVVKNKLKDAAAADVVDRARKLIARGA